MQIKTIILSFECDQKVKNRPDLLRGYFASRFEKYVLMHQHDRDGYLYYQYPLVQYKILSDAPIILGIREGVELLTQLHNKIDVIEMNGYKYEINEKLIFCDHANYAHCNEQQSYSFLTPWLALNEKNYEKYQKLGTWAKKKELLESILIGNIISMSKSLGYTVPEPIHADISTMKEVQTRLKGTPMLGFLGMFSVNFEIPDYWGIGKSVSRGFGTIRRCQCR